MTQITLDIPDHKTAFFMELIKNLGFVKLSTSPNSILTKEQIQLIEEARKKAEEHPEKMIEWEAAQQQINWDAR